ncbi:hypothetical protein GGQ74_002198 [Desulfobaculum xiamenense]|uniref:Uncharacterized protein n=1 Tax=Desulfobaculum xiamenense TaxID=995050 RepID=A0A846QSU2_9BACT|nr:hypothetical protein [Desulfobaculum xiamenense]NJB68525.1 hypothetical protein [Desulfobaculum xiamenense]
MARSNMTERELHAHIRTALSTPSGRVLRDFLRTHCFMTPARGPGEWRSAEQVAFRYGRMTLFQLVEYFDDPENFPTQGVDGP